MKWFRIILFYVVAVITSNIIRFDLWQAFIDFNDPLELAILKNSLAAIGPILGAFLIYYLVGFKREHTLFGTSKKYSMLMLLLPIIGFTIVGFPNDVVSPHYYGFWLAISLLFYAIFEEYGWRGYLQEELSNYPKWVGVVVIGFMWYAWHLSFLKTTALQPNLIFLGVCLLGSWGLGEIVRETKSIASVACFHLAGNVLFQSSTIREAMTMQERALVIVLPIILWIVILQFWKREARKG